MTDWIKHNQTGLLLLVAAASIVVGVLLAGGCSVYDVVPMPVNREVREVTGAPASIKLSEYPDIREAYVQRTAKGLEKLDQAYSDRAFFADLMASGVNIGVETGEGYLATVPGGAILLPLLTAVGGLLISKPGDKKKAQEQARQAAERAKADTMLLMQEKIDSYRKALKDATAIKSGEPVEG